MVMLPETLLRQTFTRFPRYAGHGLAIEPVEKGGSDRNYYRIRIDADQSIIAVKYGSGREENRHYVAIASFLARLSIHVPQIYFHDEDEQLIWMEDLGELDLWSFRAEPWPVRRALYESSIQQLVALHGRARAALPGSGLQLQAEFNTELYIWEQNYFFENCVHRFFGRDHHRCDSATLDAIAIELHRQPRVLVHRDFQSQNILINHARAHLIDFQGLRPGLAQYDLASLVYDPYVTLTADERAELIDLYETCARSYGLSIAPDFRRVLDLCAMQRLMQALGAYGFLGLVKKRSTFLAHIPPALASLREIVARIENLRELPALLAELCHAAQL